MSITNFRYAYVLRKQLGGMVQVTDVLYCTYDTTVMIDQMPYLRLF